jgi:drug/metabolite transporter (DMT)-like permease
LIALLFCIIPACFEQPSVSLAALGLREWLTLIWYGVFITALSYLLWYMGISRCPASTAAAFSGMMPFTALVLSVLVLGEYASLLQWCGGLLVIAGMVLIGMEKRRDAFS